MLFQKRGDFYLQDIDHDAPGKHSWQSREIEATLEMVYFINRKELGAKLYKLPTKKKTSSQLQQGPIQSPPESTICIIRKEESLGAQWKKLAAIHICSAFPSSVNMEYRKLLAFRCISPWWASVAAKGQVVWVKDITCSSDINGTNPHWSKSMGKGMECSACRCPQFHPLLSTIHKPHPHPHPPLPHSTPIRPTSHYTYPSSRHPCECQHAWRRFWLSYWLAAQKHSHKVLHGPFATAHAGEACTQPEQQGYKIRPKDL